jgi:hypothetical protein
MSELKFPLGASRAATALVVLSLFGAGVYFGYAGLIDMTEPIFVSGRELVGREGVRFGLFAMAALMGGAGLVLLVRALRNADREKFVSLDANRVVLSGFDLSGGTRAVPYAEIEELREYRVRGMPVIEIIPRGGTNIMLGAVLFRSSEAFEQFRQALRARVPGVRIPEQRSNHDAR